MFFSKKAEVNSRKISFSAGDMDGEGANLKRRNGVRARSVPSRLEKRSRVRPSTSNYSGSVIPSLVPVSRALSRNRSNSCTALGWFASDMDWRAIVRSGVVETTESNSSAVEPVIDIRHSCVKSRSPIVVHQRRPHSLVPQSAEVMLPDDVIIPQEVLSYHIASADVASKGTAGAEQLVPRSQDVFQGSADCSSQRRIFSTLNIPSGDHCASTGVL